MRRVVGAVAGALALAVGVSFAAHGAGVQPGAPVVVRTNPSNNVVGSVRTGAGQSGLGPVHAVGFQRNCSPVPGAVVVCRDPSLMHTGARATSTAGRNSCVVRLDPRVGGSAPGRRQVAAAIGGCV